jgi:poly(A) polymerase
MMMLGHLSNASVSLALGVLFHDVGKPATHEFARGRIRFNEHDRIGAEISEEIMRRLRFPNETIRQVADLVRCHMAFKDVPRMRPARLKRFLRMPEIDEHLELHRIDCLASHGKLDTYEFCRDQLAVLSEERLRPPALINGHDLIGMGLVPGELFGRILNEVEDRQLEGRLASREDALAYVRQHYVASAGPGNEADREPEAGIS